MTLGGVRASGDAAVSIGGSAQGPVTTTNIGTQVLGMSSVPLAVAAKDPEAVFTAADIDTFIGREWLATEVDLFIARNSCGYVFVEAEAGLGKTVFAAWLAKKRNYLSHFSTYSGGRSERAALQNLSAQLVMKYALDEHAPGGMLPEWAQTPSGFESLLGMAARRARGQGCPLVLVVDGLDEAQPDADGLPFGLPSLLPSSVYVIGTFRTGSSPMRPNAPSVTLRIGKEDQRNRRDIREFLVEAASEEVLAARLAEYGMEQSEFIDLLADRCDGVWVYLRYVLHELRLGLRHPDELTSLPSGLRDYYADQIRRWRDDPAWDTVLLPLVDTLGVAREPLSAEALARLAGKHDPVAVRRWCDFTLRPMLTTSRALTVGRQLRYEIYHASFREVLKALHNDETAMPIYEQPHMLAALDDELSEATIIAHARIADTYLAYFGGLDTGLRALGENPAMAGIDGGYPLRHLARHLLSACRAADLHRLLAAEHSTTDHGTTNVWFAAHDHADCVLSYLNDLAQARHDSAVSTDEALAYRQPAASGHGNSLRADGSKHRWPHLQRFHRSAWTIDSHQSLVTKPKP